jgi:four helix bundle protein
MPRPSVLNLRDRAFRFTCGVYDFCEDLAGIPGMRRRIAYQLFDAASSIGSNREEPKSAYSRKEFAAKNCIPLKESREASYWLRVADAKQLGPDELRSTLLAESNELVAILTTIVRRLQHD